MRPEATTSGCVGEGTHDSTMVKIAMTGVGSEAFGGCKLSCQGSMHLVICVFLSERTKQSAMKENEIGALVE